MGGLPSPDGLLEVAWRSAGERRPVLLVVVSVLRVVVFLVVQAVLVVVLVIVVVLVVLVVRCRCRSCLAGVLLLGVYAGRKYACIMHVYVCVCACGCVCACVRPCVCI